MNIGNRIRRYRKESGLTQQQLANEIGKSIETVKKYEAGKVNIPLTTLETLANALGVTKADLTGETDEIINAYFDTFIEYNLNKNIKHSFDKKFKEYEITKFIFDTIGKIDKDLNNNELSLEEVLEGIDEADKEYATFLYNRNLLNKPTKELLIENRDLKNKLKKIIDIAGE